MKLRNQPDAKPIAQTSQAGDCSMYVIEGNWLFKLESFWLKYEICDENVWIKLFFLTFQSSNCPFSKPIRILLTYVAGCWFF